MNPTPTELTGSDYQGNYIWSIAMNLAWNELCDHVLGKKVIFEDQTGADLVALFNQQLFHRNVVGEDTCLAKSGYGIHTVHRILQELAERFPEQSTDLLVSISLEVNELLCYAYLQKSFVHWSAFVEVPVSFLGKPVKGFSPKGQPGQGVQLVMYQDADNFVVRLLSADELEQIILIKGFADVGHEELLGFLKKVTSRAFPELGPEDRLLIPNIHFQHTRSYDELIGAKVKDEDLFLRIMKEQIKFSLDYQGARVENEAVLVMARGGFDDPKQLIFDKPFWLAMKRMDQDLPYLILRVENEVIMEPITNS